MIDSQRATPPLKKALVVRGGWNGHHPVEATELFIPHLRVHGYEVRIEDSPAVYEDHDALVATDLIVQCYTRSEISEKSLAGLIRAVRAGTGFAGWHGGIADSFRDSADYLQLVGGQFAHHPPRDEPPELRGNETDNFVEHTVSVVPSRAEHPIVSGIPGYELTSEQYWVLTDDYNDVLATTTIAARSLDAWHEPVTVPAIWTRNWGSGRIFVCTSGHDLSALENPAVRTIIERGLLWASR